jgi:PIN domain nuclease of toxin-antitoxin system
MPEGLPFGLILDTHIWIWLNQGSDELSKSIVQRIEDAANEGKIFISAISVWEVATLAAKLRVTLTIPVEQWVDEALRRQGVNLLPLSPSIAVESSRLPSDFHGDPADRMIVASARVHFGTVVTRDEKILTYARNGYVSAIKG